MCGMGKGSEFEGVKDAWMLPAHECHTMGSAMAQKHKTCGSVGGVLKGEGFKTLNPIVCKEH